MFFLNSPSQTPENGFLGQVLTLVICKSMILFLYTSHTGSTTASNTSSRPTNTDPWPAKSQQSGAIMVCWVSSPTRQDRNKLVLWPRWSPLRVAFLSGVRDSMASNNSVQKQYLHSYDNRDPLGFLPGFTTLGFQNTFLQAAITVEPCEDRLAGNTNITS